MGIKLVIAAIIFIILVSFQYTFNRILQELIEIKNILKKDKINYKG